MITPRFTLEQDDEFVIVRITLPHVKLEEGEFDIDGFQFKFHLKPYFLRLTFRQPIVEDGRERASYDWDSRVLTVHVPKAEAGVRFEGLQMLGELLAPPPNARLPPRIEVLSSAPAAESSNLEEDEDSAAAGSEWEAVQSIEEAEGRSGLVAAVGYGFNRAYSGVFSSMPPSEAMMQCPSPDCDGADEGTRRAMRLAHESEAYDDEHYTADLTCEDEEIEELLAFKPWWTIAAARRSAARQVPAGSGQEQEQDEDAFVRLEDSERERLSHLRLREHLLSPSEAARVVPAGLVDLLYAACYDWRSTLGEGTCESAWTVVALSASLAWLERFEAEPARDVCVSCVRRCLVYPLYRHWRLALLVLADVAEVLELGAPAVAKCLLRLHDLLAGADGETHLLNSIYTEDYLGWLQRASGAASRAGLADLSARVRAAAVQPEDMPAHFCALSSLAKPADAREADSDDDSTEADTETSDDDESRDEGEDEAVEASGLTLSALELAPAADTAITSTQ